MPITVDFDLPKVCNDPDCSNLRKRFLLRQNDVERLAKQFTISRRVT